MPLSSKDAISTLLFKEIYNVNIISNTVSDYG